MIYAATHAGKRHEKSEDAVLVGEILLSDEEDTLPVPRDGFICVADGVGGNYGGACASAFLLEHILSLGSPDHGGALKGSLMKINDLLIQRGHIEPALRSMATTLTGVFLGENIRLLMHIGNTRAYIRQGRYLKQITQDHTVYHWLQTTGRMDEAESCNKNEITNCFGGGTPALLSRLHISEIGAFSQMVLTSDGVHEYVDIDLMEDIMNADSSGEEKCRSLLNAALAAGSEDDMTVVLVCMEEDRG